MFMLTGMVVDTFEGLHKHTVYNSLGLQHSFTYRVKVLVPLQHKDVPVVRDVQLCAEVSKRGHVRAKQIEVGLSRKRHLRRFIHTHIDRVLHGQDGPRRHARARRILLLSEACKYVVMVFIIWRMSGWPLQTSR